MFEDKDDPQSVKKELERLEQLYTLGEVNFDSVIIIDFGNSLKSVLTSLFIRMLIKKKYCLQLLINGLMRVFFMKILLKISIILLLIIKSSKNTIINILKNSKLPLMKLQY